MFAGPEGIRGDISRKVFENAAIAIAVADPHGRIQDCNPAYRALSGYTEDELRDKSLADLVHLEDRAATIAEMERVKASEISFCKIESRFLSKSGEEIWVRNFISFVRDEGAFSGYISVLSDIRERKRAEMEAARAIASLRENEQRLSAANQLFSTAIEISPVVVFTQDLDLRFVWMHNPNAEQGANEIIGKTDFDILDRPEDARRMAALKRSVIETRVSRREEVQVYVAGRMRWFDVQITPQMHGNTVVGLLCTASDITARKQADAELRENATRIRIALHAGRFGVWDWDSSSGGISMDNTVKSLFGLNSPAARIAVEDAFAVIHPEDRESIRIAVRSALEEENIFVTEFRVRLPDETQRWLAGYGQGVRETPSAILRITGLLHDISPRKLAEESLRRSEAELRQMADSLPQLIWVAQADGQTEWFNRRWRQYAGKTFQECGEEQWSRFLHPDDAVEAHKKWRDSLATGELFHAEFRCRRYDGLWRWFLVRAEPLRTESGSIHRWVGSCTDVDDQKRAESLLRASNQDLEQFAYAASHDLQEPLRTIILYSGILNQLHRDKLDENAATYLDYLQGAGKRMKALIQDLLTYAQLGTEAQVELRPVNANQAVADALANLRAPVDEAGAKVIVEPLPTVLAAEGLLLQVFQNLIGNAIKYRRAGVVPEIHIEAEQGNCEWIFSVRDNGQGIAPRYRSKIFKLFSRLHGADIPGSGIGLATVRRSVERHGGRVWFESEPAVGSTFFFSLPFN